MKTVYLGGPISGLNFQEADNWRSYLTMSLKRYGIHCLSPLRGKEDFLAQVGIIEGAYEACAFATPAAIVCRDRYDCQHADAVIFNLLGAMRISIGTMVEYGWTDGQRKPIITIMEKSGNPHDHPFIRQLSGYIVETHTEAIHIARTLLVPHWRELAA